jgi:hypothetical protein
VRHVPDYTQLFGDENSCLGFGVDVNAELFDDFGFMDFDYLAELDV